jgi:hypothetical protein
MKLPSEKTGASGWRMAILSGGVAVILLRVILGLMMGVTWIILRPYLSPNLILSEFHELFSKSSLQAEALLSVWLRWDAIHHLNLARLGYLKLSEAESVFYPLYAGLTRLTTVTIGGDYLIGGLIVSTLSAWGAFACLYWLAEHFYQGETAQWSVVALAIYPTAIFLVAPYTESLFLALTMAAFIAAYKGRWLAAGLLGCLASLARGPGIFTSAALAWIAWDQWRGMQSKQRGKIVSMLAGLLLPVIGGLTFLLWRTWMGFPTIADITRQYSGLILVNPVRGLASAIIQWVHIHDLQTTLDLFSALFFIFMGIVMFANRRWRKVEWLVYMAINLLIFLSKESFQASSLQSMARYVLVLFPVFIALGDWLRSQSHLTRLICTTISTTIMIVLSTLYALWVFIG